jgi:hypothetical protein
METLYFFLDSDSPFNCLNASIKILLPYIRKFLRRKIIKLEQKQDPTIIDQSILFREVVVGCGGSYCQGVISCTTDTR